jgi:hypothetical protein
MDFPTNLMKDKQRRNPAGKSWGLLGIVASVFGVWLFSKFETPPHHSIDRIAPKDKPDHEGGGAKNFASLPTHIPPSPSNREDTCKCCHQKIPRWKIALDWLMFIVTAGAFASAAIYACITYRMWREMQTQTQTQTAREQLEMAERPWITVENIRIPSDEPLIVWKSTVMTVITFDVKNIGHSPATNVTAHVLLMPPGGAVGEIVKSLCESNPPPPPEGFGETIFPDRLAGSLSYPVPTTGSLVPVVCPLSQGLPRLP